MCKKLPNAQDLFARKFNKRYSHAQQAEAFEVVVLAPGHFKTTTNISTNKFKHQLVQQPRQFCITNVSFLIKEDLIIKKH